VLVLRGIEDALGISEKVFSSLVADSSVKMNIISNIELFGQVFKFFLMLDVLRNFEIVASSNDQFYSIFALLEIWVVVDQRSISLKS
jgi:hypothetical protein